MSFSLLSQSHCTHCTDVISRWISALPRAMCLFFACHWCHSIAKVTSVTWHFCLSLHGEDLKINELQHSCNEWHEFYDVEKIRLRKKQIRAGEFLFCEGEKEEKLEEEIWKHQQLLKILLQVLGWINISKNYHSKKNEFDTCFVWNSIRTDLRHSNRLKISIECRKW